MDIGILAPLLVNLGLLLIGIPINWQLVFLEILGGIFFGILGVVVYIAGEVVGVVPVGGTSLAFGAIGGIVGEVVGGVAAGVGISIAFSAIGGLVGLLIVIIGFGIGISAAYGISGAIVNTTLGIAYGLPGGTLLSMVLGIIVSLYLGIVNNWMDAIKIGLFGGLIAALANSRIPDYLISVIPSYIASIRLKKAAKNSNELNNINYFRSITRTSWLPLIGLQSALEKWLDVDFTRGVLILNQFVFYTAQFIPSWGVRNIRTKMGHNN